MNSVQRSIVLSINLLERKCSPRPIPLPSWLLPSVILIMHTLCVCVGGRIVSHALLFVTPWTVDSRGPLSMLFSRQKYWSGLPFTPPEDLLNPGIDPLSPALTGRFFTTGPPGKTTKSISRNRLEYLVLLP